MMVPADMQLVLSLAAMPGSSGFKMHNAGYRALGINAFYLPRRYAGDIAPALAALRTLNIRGASLTMPHKQTCLPYLDTLSPEARAIGAVNTVVQENGVLTGYNTDGPAAQSLIAQHLPYREAPLVILGSGGMAAAFAYAAQQLQVNAFVCARDADKTAMLAKRFGHAVLPWGDVAALKDTVLCHATPVGMRDAPEMVHYFQAALSRVRGVFDAVANPAETALVTAARAAELPVVSGDMLALEQACLQFEIYTGHAAPREVMREALYA